MPLKIHVHGDDLKRGRTIVVKQTDHDQVRGLSTARRRSIEEDGICIDRTIFLQVVKEDCGRRPEPRWDDREVYIDVTLFQNVKED
jgi:hypothetical protein